MVTGLEPRGFVWVIQDRLAVSERIGGHGFQHRRVRRTEEITWIRGVGITDVLSLLGGGQNVASYEEGGLGAHQAMLVGDFTDEDVVAVWEQIDVILAHPGAALLVHRDIVDDAVAGVLGGYLVHSGLIDDPIVATSIIQAIVGRPLGPEGRRLIPSAATS
jgi:hypothetical protein